MRAPIPFPARTKSLPVSLAVTAALILTLAPTPSRAAEPTPQDQEVLVARYAVLLGGREPGSAPTTGSVMGGDDLVDRLLDWDPEVDSDEVRRILALDELGELGRQAAALTPAGGTVGGSYDHDGLHYEVSVDIHPGGTAEDGRELLTVSGQIAREGELISAPTIRTFLGERVFVASEDAFGDFLFLVVETERTTARELRRRGLRHVWSDEYLLVDGIEVQPPQIVEKTVPEYPHEAKEGGHEGVVVLRAAIDTKGRVESVEVVEGLPHGMSEAAALAVRQWRFEPARRNGEPVKVLYLLTVRFRLSG